MKNYRELEKMLISMERKSYSAYKSLKGDYKYDNYILSIDHVQSDSYAPPSKMRIVMPRKVSGIPKELPALLRALKLQEKASRVGFDWPDKAGAVAKFEEEKAEMEAADSPENHLEEWGDMFFALSNWARLANIDPEQALQRSNDKFVRRFNYLEQQVQGSGRTWSDFTLAELNALWEAAKKAGL